MGVENCPGPEEADAGNDLSRNARGIAVGSPVRGEADLADGDGEVREERRTDADKYVRTEAGGLAGDLAFESDGAAKQRREEQLEQQRQSQNLGKRAE